MKKLLIALICVSLILPVLPILPVARAADIFGAPKMKYLGTDQSPEDYIFRFSLDTGDAAGYEIQRQELYNQLHEKYTDEQLIDAGQGWVTYPTVLQIYLNTDGYTVLLGEYSVLPKTFTLSAVGDILPALARTGLYKHTASMFSLYCTVALGTGDAAAAVSPETVIEGLFYPATAHIVYRMEADAVNPNAEYLILPYDTFSLAYPTRQGYTFAGWINTDSGASIGAIKANTLDLSLTPRWTPRTFRINYVLTTRPGNFVYVNNTGNPTVRTYGTDTEIFSVNPPYGYLFAGWYLTPEFTGDPVTSIPGTKTGDTILYARWQTQEEMEAEVIETGRWGDLDGDGKISAADARHALRAAVGLEILTPEQVKRVDFIGNGHITASTARQLLRVAVGLDRMYEVLVYYELV